MLIFTLDPLDTVVATFMNLHVKCPIFSVEDNEDAESHLLCSIDLMNSQVTAEEAKWGRICLTLGSDAY